MKFTAPVGFLALGLLSVLNASWLWALPVQGKVAPKPTSPKSTPRVTRDNFISLSWQQTGGFAGTTTSLRVEGNTLSYFSGRPFRGEGSPNEPNAATTATSLQTSRISNRQLDSLIEKLNQSRIPALVGKYRQPRLADGFEETLILTISDDTDRDQHFVIENYGDRAPKGYFAFVGALRKLGGMKFSDSSLAPVPAAKTAPK